MKTLKQLLNEYKEKSKKNKINNIKRDFDVDEKNGRIYITLCGHAFAEMPMYASAYDITNKLEEARKAAMEFEGL